MKKNSCFASLVSFVSIVLSFSFQLAAKDDISFEEEPTSAIVKPTQEFSDRVSTVQNAILEGIQLSSENGEKPQEQIISCFFIFRDKPTSYFYEAKTKENKLVFEFNDTELGVSPIPSMQEKPIQGFRIEPIKVDVNAEVKGLKPEWHDVIRVTLYMDAVPEISVKDEYSVISFTFPWSTDPAKAKTYVAVDKDKKTKALILSIGGGVGIAAAAGIVYYFLSGDTTETPELDIGDLPVRPAPNIIR